MYTSVNFFYIYGFLKLNSTLPQQVGQVKSTLSIPVNTGFITESVLLLCKIKKMKVHTVVLKMEL